MTGPIQNDRFSVQEVKPCRHGIWVCLNMNHTLQYLQWPFNGEYDGGNHDWPTDLDDSGCNYFPQFILSWNQFGMCAFGSSTPLSWIRPLDQPDQPSFSLPLVADGVLRKHHWWLLSEICTSWLKATRPGPCKGDVGKSLEGDGAGDAMAAVIHTKSLTLVARLERTIITKYYKHSEILGALYCNKINMSCSYYLSNHWVCRVWAWTDHARFIPLLGGSPQWLVTLVTISPRFVAYPSIVASMLLTIVFNH